MLLLEHDAKELLAGRGLPVPRGELLGMDAAVTTSTPGPWMLKAQVPSGGRGKAGGIRQATTAAEFSEAVAALRQLTIRGHQVREVRVETVVSEAAEAFIGISVDAAKARLVVMASAQGGVDVEKNAGTMMRAEALADSASLQRGVDTAVAQLPPALQRPIRAAGRLIAEAFLHLDATLLELNPLFVLPDGSWVAGDVRLAVDESALPRQPELAALLDRRAEAYPDAAFKRVQGYDLLVVDPNGEIGLVTTGAGLSMKLIDEMTARGARPYNFCDIRSGMMRGDPTRLVEALRRVGAGPRIRVVLVNIFAGITDLGEFADLLVQAVRNLPELRAPLVVRLVGNGEEKAETLLRASGLDFIIERDLERAVELCTTGRHVPA